MQSEKFDPDWIEYPGDEFFPRYRVSKSEPWKCWAKLEECQHKGLQAEFNKRIVELHYGNKIKGFVYADIIWSVWHDDAMGNQVFRNTEETRQMGIDKHNERIGLRGEKLPDRFLPKKEQDDNFVPGPTITTDDPAVKHVFEELQSKKEETKRERYTSARDKELWSQDIITLTIRPTRLRIDRALLREALERGYELTHTSTTDKGLVLLLRKKKEEKK